MLLSSLFSLASLGVDSAAATTISVDRRVLADSWSRAPGEYDPVSNAYSTQNPGVFDRRALAASNETGVDGIARATQYSEVGTDRINFFGSTTVGAFASGPNTLGDHQSQSSLQLYLEFGSAQSYSIEGILSAASSSMGDSYSSFELREVGGATLYSAEVYYEGSQKIATSGILLPHVSYEVTILLRSAGSVNGRVNTISGEAGANILMTVPEPGTAVLLGLGLALLAPRPNRHPTRGRSPSPEPR